MALRYFGRHSKAWPQPVLSREFYQKLGDKIADELVHWFNQVDATYRSEFKDLFEANFARFDAKLEQRLVQFDARLDRGLAEPRSEFLATLERRLGEQTRWLFGALAVMLGSVIGLRFRG